MPLSERVAKYIEQETILEPEQEVVVGVSGGPDSLCLLYCLIELGFKPLAAHFDHQLRPESSEEAEFVRKTAESLSVPFRLGHGPVLKRKGSVEEVARLQRYQFLASIAEEERIDRVAVGHTANDQAETVLMHLIRGAGPSGLRGMLAKTQLGSWAGISAVEGIYLVRPLLEIWRHETVEFCEDRGLEARTDPSNQDVRFFRNRLRNELMPELETYNPRVQEVLVRTAKVMAAESEVFDSFLEDRWLEWVNSSGEDALVLHVDLISSAPLALQRAAMRRAILQLATDLRDISFDSVEKALAAMRARRRASVSGDLDLLAINGDVVLRRSGSEIRFEQYPQMNSSDPIALNIPGELQLRAGWTISASRLEPRLEFPEGAAEAWFDAEKLPDKLEIRTALPGDRFAPLGMSGSMKVSDLFINRKVPQMARSRWPLITSADQIIWIPGLHRFDGARVTAETRVMLAIKLKPPLEGDP